MVVGYIKEELEKKLQKQRKRKGFGRIHSIGEKLYDLYIENNLVIGCTLFKHININEATWNFPDNIVNQTVHVILNQKWRRSLQDVRARRGADVE